MTVWDGDSRDFPMRKAFDPKSHMESDIYRGFSALQEQGHFSGVVLFVDEGESYSVIGKVCDRSFDDTEEKNSIVREIIERQNSIPYGSDTNFNRDGTSTTYVRYKKTLLVLDLEQDFTTQWPFLSILRSPESLRTSFGDTLPLIFPGLDLRMPKRKDMCQIEIIPPEPYGRVDVQEFLLLFEEDRVVTVPWKNERIDIYELNQKQGSPGSQPKALTFK